MMLRPSAAPTPPPLQQSALPLTNGKTAYNPSQKLRWLVVAVALLVVATLALRVPREPGAAKALGCHVSSAADFRAAPGAALRDDGGCVAPTALDAGVCVEARGRLGRRCVPSLAVIGAMKSGTTNIMLYLQLHPALRTSENWFGWPVESRFFSNADDASAADAWRDYLSLYPRASPGVLTFDKSPNYLVNAKVPAVLARLAPSLKLVVMLRDPTKRAYSHFQHECRNGRVRRDAGGRIYRSSCAGKRAADCGPGTTRRAFPCLPADFASLVAAAIAAHPPTRPDWRCAWSLGDDGRGDSNVVPRGFYDCQLQRWFAHFPRDQLRAFVFEEFLASRAATLEAVAAVETFVGVENFDYGASWTVSLVERLYAAVPSRGGAYAPMPPATKESLDGLYCDANRDLAATLGRSLPWPCGDAPRRSARGGPGGANGTRVTRRT